MRKTKCSYCGGVTVDDMRGNCGACGAPRSWSNHIKWLDPNPEPPQSISDLKRQLVDLQTHTFEYTFTIRIDGT